MKICIVLCFEDYTAILTDETKEILPSGQIDSIISYLDAMYSDFESVIISKYDVMYSIDNQESMYYLYANKMF